MVYKFYEKNSAGSGRPLFSALRITNDKNKQNMQLGKELHKPIIRNSKKRTVYSRFKHDIWSANLVDLDFYYALLIFLVNMLGLFL